MKLGPHEARQNRSAASGFAPLRKLYLRNLWLGLAAIAVGVGIAFAGSAMTAWTVTPLVLAAGGFLTALGVWGLRVGAATQVLSSSLNYLQAGKLTEAETLLDSLSRHTATAVKLSVHVQRAMIAVRRGGLDDVLFHTSAILNTPLRVFFRSNQEAQRSAAVGMRAWAHAAKRDTEAALNDIRAAREGEIPTAEGLSHASLAHAMVLEQKGDKAALAAHLARDRRLLLGSLDIRQRAIVRAMQRMLSAPPRSIYRTSADTKNEEPEELPTTAQWISRVAPGLAAFAPQQKGKAASRDGAPEMPSLPEPSVEAQKRALARPPQKMNRRSLKALLVWVILVSGGLAIWQALSEPPSSQPRPRAVAPAEPSPLLGLSGVGVLALLVAILGWKIVRNQKQARKLYAVAADFARGADVDAVLLELSNSKLDLVAAQAELLRSAVADRRARFEDGIQYVDAGRARLASEASRAAAAGILTPALTASRAYLLAALGRAEEAAAELLQLPHDYLLLDRTSFAVGLVARLAQGDLEGAARLVEASSPELSMGPRDELLRDLVRAAMSPSGAGAGEIERLRQELREDDESRTWIERVAPALLGRFHEVTAPADLPPEEHEAAALEEARATEEAESHEGGRRVAGAAKPSSLS